jgi:GWxTD domain-containing protein
LPKIFSFIVLLSSTVFFSLLQAQSNNKSAFQLDLDYARFRGEQNLTLVEIYYAFHRDSILHVNSDDKYIATYQTKLEISVKDSVIKTIEWRGQDLLNSLDDLKPNQTINDVHKLLLGQGDFKVRLEVMDLANQKTAFNEIDFQVVPQRTDSLWISDIQVGLKIAHSQSQSRFIKNGLSIIPNPSSIFSLQWPVLYYYCEIYNLNNPSQSDNAKYNIITNIKDIKGDIIKKIPAKSKNIYNSSIVEIDKTLVSSLRSGVYELHIEVVNLSTDEQATEKKQFFVYRAADYIQSETESQQKLNDLYLVLLTKSEEELDIEFGYTAYMATSDEEEMYEELDLEGKRKFLVSFWGLKNNTPGLSTESFRRNYLDRVIIANDRYSYGSTEGWETARGRILLMYGIPDDINKQYGGRETKQYETWTYNALEGGSYFIFLDISGYGNYQLVHSTVSTEINDMNWQENYMR